MKIPALFKRKGKGGYLPSPVEVQFASNPNLTAQQTLAAIGKCSTSPLEILEVIQYGKDSCHHKYKLW